MCYVPYPGCLAPGRTGPFGPAVFYNPPCFTLCANCGPSLGPCAPCSACHGMAPRCSSPCCEPVCCPSCCSPGMGCKFITKIFFGNGHSCKFIYRLLELKNLFRLCVFLLVFGNRFRAYLKTRQ